MIESVHLAKTATYGDARQYLTGLKMFNYIYGSNGSGKTTISRVLATPLMQVAISPEKAAPP